MHAGNPNVSGRTLRDWITRLQSEGYLFASEKDSGRSEYVIDDKIRILVEWILTKKYSGTIVRMKRALLFLTNKLNTEASERSLQRYLSSMGPTVRAPVFDSKDNVEFETKVELYTSWIKELRSSVATNKLVCSLDFTYTSHRISKPTTLGGRGRKTLMYSSRMRYSNCIITGILSDRRQLNSILYTYNPHFHTNRTPTKRRHALSDELSQIEKKYLVKDERIV